ncbi:MAG: 16S rRNA (cytosine(967)-C(5))-methyltransferase RsmB [Sulfuritalea sp.]|nr:16S rRNA (cytosine(967)-C(5))-methyltransferase RsmB [Sulfuritalea sp.]
MLPPLAESLYEAAGLIAAVLSGRNFDAALSRTGLSGQLRAAAMDLVYPTLRAFGRGDFLLGQLLERPLKDKSARGLLLAALARLEARPDDAPTIVNQAVKAATRLAHGQFKGLVNGVLRSFLRRREELLAAADADPVAQWRHPAWWIERLRKDHPAHWQSILAAGNTHPPMCLRINRRRTTSADFLSELAADGIAARALDDDAILLARPVPVDRIPGFAEGLCSVQDWGAQAAAHLLDLGSGMRVLDACAAPGGKTAHLLEIADIELTALDVDDQRTTRITSNLRRLGLTANVQVADACAVDAWWDGHVFDRVLVDAPCSASGVVRRHPDAKWLRRKTDLAGFATTQKTIVDALWRTLAPGGKMLYASCSVFEEENAHQVEAFIGRHADARQLPTQLQSYGPKIGPECVTTTDTTIRSTTRDNQLQLLPDAEHDGFYYALLQKT